jgi:hypothetical protein
VLAKAAGSRGLPQLLRAMLSAEASPYECLGRTTPAGHQA